MWQGLLNGSEVQIPNIYIDAFANDYLDDAFIAVASAITGYADANTSKSHEEAVAEFRDKAKKVGGRLLSWTAKLGVKAATLGTLSAGDFKELAELKDDLAKGVSGVVGDFIEERLASHAKDIELLTSFKELLSDLPTYLHNGKGKPLVIIIDELDRCRPTYAVEVIEKIKHLFSVKNVVFVLVMNKKQLEESIRCVYGREIDAHIYLQKFINLETTIPKRIEDTDIDKNDIQRYCRRLWNCMRSKHGGKMMSY